MRNALTYSFILITTLYLTGCSSLPNGKFSPSFQDFPIETHLVKKEYERPLNVIIPQMSNAGGGLIGAVIVGVANGVSASKRSHGVSEIRASFSANDYHAAVGDLFPRTLEKSDILDIKERNTISSIGHSEGNKAFDNLVETTELGYVTSISSYASIGEFYHNLTHSVLVEIKKKEEKQNTQVFRLVLHETFIPSEIKDTEDLENYRYWTQDDNALIKKALTETSTKLKTSLSEALENSTVVK